MDRRIAILLAAVVVLAAIPAPVAADETRTGGTVVVGPNETVNDDLTVFGGTAIVRGTVNGDLTVFAGDVFVDGRVDGDLSAVGGNIRVNGTVTGDASAAGGNFFLAQSGRIGGQLDAGAGNAVVNGEVGGDVRLGADTITLGPNAAVGGDFVYNGDLQRAPGAQVDGQVRRDESLGPNIGPDIGPVGFRGPLVPNWISWVYGFLANLLLGALVLLAFPRFSAGVADRAADQPVRSGGVGILLFVGVPVAAVLLFISLVGIPLGLLVILLYPLLLWLGFVYGSFAIGGWLAEFADTDNRWLALVVGLLVTSIVGLIPILGGIVQFLVLLLGLGALGLGGRNRYRERRENRVTGVDTSPDTDTTV